MSRRKVYIVKTGSLNTATNEFWLTPSYYSSKKNALYCANQILEINRAKEVNILKTEADGLWNNEMWRADYIGEEGKYTGCIIIEWAYLNSY